MRYTHDVDYTDSSLHNFVGQLDHFGNFHDYVEIEAAPDFLELVGEGVHFVAGQNLLENLKKMKIQLRYHKFENL